MEGFIMQDRAAGKVSLILVCLLPIILMSGCAVTETKTSDRLPVHAYYPAVLVFAEQTLKEAREAGKDKLCPEEYKKAEQAVAEAYKQCLQCSPLGPIPINIECPVPTCELKADKHEIRKGEAVKLTMTTSGEITSARLDGTDAALYNGTVSVKPTSSTTYTVHVVGPRGSGTCSDRVEVYQPPPPPKCTLTADRSEIGKGEAVKLTITTSGEVTSATLAGINVAVTGETLELKPTSAMHYNGIVEGPGGSYTCIVPVSVSLTLDIYFPFDRPDGKQDDFVNWFDYKDAYDSKDLKDPSRRGTRFTNNNLEYNEDELNKAIEFVRTNPAGYIIVEGHTDRMGTSEYNRDLSFRRATAVARYLTEELAIDPEKILAQGKGKEEPVRSCQQLTPEGKDNPECRALNRRVKIIAKPISHK